MEYNPKYRTDFMTVKYGRAFRRGGTEYISGLIAQGIADGSRTAVITGSWDIKSHIRIPSDFTLIFDGCCLKMADETFDNMFVNEHHGTELGKTPAGTDHNIRLLGKNGAIIDGGTFNGLTERTGRKDGMPPVYKNNLILFTNVDGFETAGLAFHNFRWWAVNHIYCANGHIHDIDLLADDTCIAEDGTVYHGLSLEHYYDMLIKQADGINFRLGCHDMLVENIRGFAGDDVVALTSLNGKMEQTFAVEGYPADLCNITVRHVHACALDSCVRLLCQGGTTLHDILVEDVCDSSDGVHHIRGRALQTIRVGDSHIMYGSRHSTAEEFYNITIRGVRSRAEYALYLGGKSAGNCVFEDIEAFDGGGTIWDCRNDDK